MILNKILKFSQMLIERKKSQP